MSGHGTNTVYNLPSTQLSNLFIEMRLSVISLHKPINMYMNAGLNVIVKQTRFTYLTNREIMYRSAHSRLISKHSQQNLSKSITCDLLDKFDDGNTI